MALHSPNSKQILAWLICALAATGGCSHIRLPAIDPSGQRIFLPPPASTSLALPELPIFPRPAFQDVPVPPPCGTAQSPGTVPAPRPAGLHGILASHHGEDNVPGRLQLSPTKLIAPVGSEVVLLSGLCGPDSHLVTKQPIEFTLSQDSVGQFVDAAENEGCLSKCFSNKCTGKLAANFVVTRASQREHLVTRGTPQVTDDVYVARGQTWASLTSATEGSSYVTVVAPNGECWDKRRQTAIIHWVDAQWTFPAPAVAPAGGRVTLTTTVTRSDGSPLPNAWLVRYEITGGTPATFGQRSENSIEIPTDPQGRAGVDLISQNDEPGSTQIRIQVIRQATNGSPRLVVGEGFTNVTWRAAGLTLQLAGPSSISVGSPLVYRIIVTNPGDIASHDVIVALRLPPLVSFVRSNREPERSGDTLQWRLGDLAPHSTSVIEFECRGDRAGSMTVEVEGQSREGRRVRARTATDIIAQSLTLRLEPERDTVDVGGRVVFLGQITNTGDRPLRNIRLTTRFDDNLEHVSRQLSPISVDIASLAPGDTYDAPLTFVTRRPGQACIALDANSSDSATASARACVSVVAAAARPQIEVRLESPGSREQGETAEVTLTARNTGNVPLNDVRLSIVHDANTLEARQASANFARSPGEFYWVVPVLRPGETATRQVNFLCRAATRRTELRGVASAGTTTMDDTQALEITGGNAIEAQPDDAADNRPQPRGDGQLQLSLNSPRRVLAVAENQEIVITVRNDRGISDRNILITFDVPQGVRYLEARGISAAIGPPTAEPTGTGVTGAFQRINELRAGEELKLGFTIEGRTPGTHRIEVQVRSQLMRDGQTASIDFTVTER